METTELEINIAGNEYIVEAEVDKSIKNAIAKVLPHDINFNEYAIATLGILIDGDRSVKEIISEIGSSVFEISRRSTIG